MKLKKIASLALAGVMAVSMLAGCSTASNNQPEQPEQPTNPATGYSTMVGNNLSAAAKSKVTMSDSNDLDKALESNIMNLKTDFRASDGKNDWVTGDSADLALDYNYVVSVSADTITLDANHGKSVTVVAVNVARNLGE